MNLNSKEVGKRFQRSLARNGMYFFYWLFTHLPYRFVKKMIGLIVAIGFKFTVKQKKIAKESLKIAFGKNKTDEEIDFIIKENFTNLGRGMVEMVYFLSHPKEALDKISFEGKDHLDAAIKKNKGVIVVTAHFGNFPLMMLCFTKMGYKSNCIIRPTRDQELEKFLLKKREKSGLNTIYAIPRQQCVLNSLKALRSNEVLFVPLDQNFGSGAGVFVDFFGQKAATATGPVVFALRTGAPILPMFIIRDNDDKHKILIEPELNLDLFDNEEKTLSVNTQRITDIIERYIRKYPYEWGWMHRRWKSQPKKNRNIKK